MGSHASWRTLQTDDNDKNNVMHATGEGGVYVEMKMTVSLER
jgi:hypothetical protein